MISFQPFSRFAPSVNDAPIVIVGAGLAGLFAALKLSEISPWPLVLLSPARLGDNSASAWAQGGIAAAVGPNDSAQQHAGDTLDAGSGLNVLQVVEAICKAGPTHIEQLDAYGVPFDRRQDKKYALSREAAHSTKRIVRCTGDSSGRMIMDTLIAAARQQPQISILEGVVAHQLLRDPNAQICGVAFHTTASQTNTATLRAKAVILACGGVGALFQTTTNPSSVQGQGLGMAALAGATIADSEFVQFHPTALDFDESPQPLASEALRGEGATLLDANFERFMLHGPHEEAELASRDVVAREVFCAREQSGAVYLDCRHLCPDSDQFAHRFPTLWQNARRHGLNPHRDLLPVIPAAHYHMGGIATDLRGRSSVAGLWAIGEVACTGLHGANRLASNSLLEAVVMAGNAAKDIQENLGNSDSQPKTPIYQRHREQPGSGISDPISQSPNSSFLALQAIMSKNVGVVRSKSGLLNALHQILGVAPPNLFATQCPNDINCDTNPEILAHDLKQIKALEINQNNSLVAALFITSAALLRSESRGSHYCIASSPKLSPKLHKLLGLHCSDGQRSFLNWQLVCEILEALKTESKAP